MANEPTNAQGLTVQQMSQAAANPQQFGLNPQGLTAPQMIQASNQQMQNSTIGQAQANPGTLAVGSQTGATPSSPIPASPITFQAQTSTPDSRRAAALPEIARMNGISLEEAGADP
jgi:hypothetical protein